MAEPMSSPIPISSRVPEEPPSCWLCHRAIVADEFSRSLLGDGTFEVHVSCYERELRNEELRRSA
jgi:hypothetical protein